MLRFGPYEALSEMGHGGMGVVHRCRHVSTGQLVAVKLARDRDEARRTLLQREIGILLWLGRRRVPGISKVLDYSSGDPRIWYAMEYVEGGSLAQLRDRAWESTAHVVSPAAATTVHQDAYVSSVGLARRAQPRGRRPPAANGQLREVMRIGYELARTLAHVHGLGIVHGDLSPENVLLHEDGRVTLIDFGTALHMPASEGPRELIEEQWQRFGTPGYLAPELAQGNTLCDPRCDLYALGCVLYELITGRLPLGASLRSDVVLTQARSLPHPPSTWVEGVPPELDELLMHMLEPDANERLSFALDVADKLAALLGLRGASRGQRKPPFQLLRSSFAGRDRTLSELTELLEQTREKQGGRVFLTGESGVGKTRTLIELSSRASRMGFRVISGQCVESFSHASLGAARGRLLGLFGRVFSALATSARESPALREELATAFDVLRPVAPELSPHASDDALTQLPAPLHRDRLVRALLDCLRALSREQPLLLLLEDLHWADGLSLEVLSSKQFGALSQLPVLIVSTLRSEAGEAKPNALLEGARVIELGPLPLAAVRSMISEMLGEPAPAKYSEAVFRQSGGNPLSVAELLRVSMQRGIVERRSGAAFRVRPGGLRRRPLGIARRRRPLGRVVGARFAGLSEGAAALVGVCAVLGRELSRDLLESVAAHYLDSDWAMFSLSLEELTSRGILEETARGQYRFAHDALREVALSRVRRGERRRIHAEAAARLEAQPQTGTGMDREAALAQHWVEANHPSRALVYVVKAAERATRLHANERAVELWELALAQLKRVHGPQSAWPKETVSYLETLADLLAQTGRLSPARSRYRAVLRLLSDTRQPEAEARILRKLAQTYWTRYRYGTAKRLLDRAGQVLGDKVGRAPLAVRREWIELEQARFVVAYFHRRRLSEASAILERLGPVVERDGTPSQRSLYYQCRANALVVAENYRFSEAAVAYEERALSALEGRSEARLEQAHARFDLGFMLALGGREHCGRARTVLLEALAEAERYGDLLLEARALTYLTIALRKLGRPGQVRLWAERAQACAARAELTDYLAVAHACLGWEALKRGDHQGAERWLSAADAAWQRASTGRKRSPFPFYWLADLPSLVLAHARRDQSRASQLLESLLHPSQQRLAPTLEDALRELRDTGLEGPGARTAFRRVVREARRHDYL